jgi:hypothetical protein
MAKTASQVARQSLALRQTLTDLYLEFLREFAPRSTERLINSGIELMEAHRELIAERIARLEEARKKLNAPTRRTASRKVAVRKRAGASRQKRTAATSAS